VHTLKNAFFTGCSFPGFEVICRDDIRVELFGDVTHHGDEKAVTDTVKVCLPA
jgi:hypothetical protein